MGPSHIVPRTRSDASAVSPLYALGRLGVMPSHREDFYLRTEHFRTALLTICGRPAAIRHLERRRRSNVTSVWRRTALQASHSRAGQFKRTVPWVYPTYAKTSLRIPSFPGYTPSELYTYNLPCPLTGREVPPGTLSQPVTSLLTADRRPPTADCRPDCPPTTSPPTPDCPRRVRTYVTLRTGLSLHKYGTYICTDILPYSVQGYR